MATMLLYNCDNEPLAEQNVNSEKRKKLPNIEEAVFSKSTSITNAYYGPAAGKIYVYTGGEVGMDPEEEIRIERRTLTKEIMGVRCIVQNDIVYLNGIIIEDTDDWLAQDDDGNLWYFGEFVKNYDDDGNFLDNEGSFEYGIDGALPGYWLPGNPYLGQAYYQEYYRGNAEDQAEVIAINEKVTIGLGSWDCLVTKDFSRFEPYVYEKKYYATGVGLIKEEKFEKRVLVEVIELTEIIDK